MNETTKEPGEGEGASNSAAAEGGEAEETGAAPDKEAMTSEDRVALAEREAEEFRGKWMRAAADYQNLKRRSEQELQERSRYANASLIINILPIVDDFERAFSTLDARLAGLTWTEGIVNIYRKFRQALESAGVREIEAEGIEFDPNVHEAIQYSEGDDGKVISVVQKGYKLGDRVIRPAVVVVGRGGGEGTADENENPSAPGGK
ncbi:MAG: nucleotide exchange factor GrpE [Dehalococcoidia bacterium]|nr:nucleotide exchange factor GrpE [Dehalococcoidia bacterium]